MNRKISTAAAAVLMLAVIICAALPAFASSAPTRDGVYEVSVKMYHAQKDKTSMGDKYLVHTALLTVKNGGKTLTIATPESVSGMRFWYYKNGGVDGETVEVKPAGGVKIAGTEYQSAFEFPIVGDGEFVGVKFSAPVMPMSPSARIHIDYASAKKLPISALPLRLLRIRRLPQSRRRAQKAKPRLTRRLLRPPKPIPPAKRRRWRAPRKTNPYLYRNPLANPFPTKPRITARAKRPRR